MAAGGDAVRVVSRGWHTAIGVPAGLLRGQLAWFRAVFPGARVVVFGYGKRTFMTAPADDWREYLIGPFPGPGVIEAFGLRTDLVAAYGSADQVRVALPPRGAARLSDFIWNDLAPGAAGGGPRLVAAGSFAGSLLYASRSRYTAGHTCNAWVVDALAAAGVPVSAAGVVFSGQAMGRLNSLARGCPAS